MEEALSSKENIINGLQVKNQKLQESIDILQTKVEEIQGELFKVNDDLKFSLQEQAGLCEKLNNKENEIEKMNMKLSNTQKNLEIAKIAKVDQGLLRKQQIKQQLTEANSKFESLTQELCEKPKFDSSAKTHFLVFRWDLHLILSSHEELGFLPPLLLLLAYHSKQSCS